MKGSLNWKRTQAVALESKILAPIISSVHHHHTLFLLPTFLDHCFARVVSSRSPLSTFRPRSSTPKFFWPFSDYIIVLSLTLRKYKTTTKMKVFSLVIAFLPAVASFSVSSTVTTYKLNNFALHAMNGDTNGESKKKVIVLGGDGFCGWPTSLYLSDQGHDIVIVDNLSRRKIDLDLGCDSLTPIASMEVRSSMHESIPCSDL